MHDVEAEGGSPAVAVIGLAGMFPGAPDLKVYWENLLAGRDTITRFSREQVESRDRASAEFGPDYVPAHGILDRAEWFDAEFFGIAPRDADYMDPQHRLFLQTCWNALEDGGYAVENPPGLVGVFGGCSLNTYLLANLTRDRAFLDELTAKYQVGEFQTSLGNDKDFLCTRVAYKLNLRGPAMTVQAACATSLVAISQACQSLMTYQCDMALAGGVSVTFPQHRGYTYEEGSIGSRDGHCRPFDADATGTVFGHGVGVVLLKRLEDALHDGDRIDAVVRGWAVNNDGGAKAGYMAPGVAGQAELVAAAHAMAGIGADEIGYVETHGTATPLGDPVEVAALTKAFRQTTEAKKFCALGSVKANIGHLDAAAGVSGFIKTVLALRHRTIPPLTNFSKPNPRIEFEETPFYIPREAKPWESVKPFIAGVSAFGVGGVNAHLVLEEPPRPAAKADPQSVQELLQVSARSQTALTSSLNALAEHFEREPDLDLASVAFTLRHARRNFAFRATVAASTAEEAASQLRVAASAAGQSRRVVEGARAAFLFPGQGAQSVGMGAGLYATHAVFARALDRCLAILIPELGPDLGPELRPMLVGTDVARYEGQLDQTSLAQPALFAMEWAMAELWKSWGVEPQAMAGHSLGEYVAATLAGVFELEDALRLVALRGRLAQSMKPGSMLSVRLSEQDALAAIAGRPELALAAINSPSLSVVAGPTDAIQQLAARLEAQGTVARVLRTSHAFHSAMMDPMLDEFGAAVAKLRLRAPKVPFVSTATGRWITPEECTDPSYWVRHCRVPVRFSEAAALLSGTPGAVPIEVGPGQTLATLMQQQNSKGVPAIVSLPRGQGKTDGAETMYPAAGRAWQAGLSIDWKAFDHGRSQRVALPTYPFELKRHWIEPPAGQSTGDVAVAKPQTDVEQGKAAGLPGADEMMDKRAVRLEPRVAELFEEISGMSVDADAYGTSFLDLGFDSLLLTQATQAIQRSFGVKVTFRQILEDYTSISALATRLDEILPPDAFPAAPAMAAAATAVPATAAFAMPSVQPPGTSGGPLEDLFRAQMQAMSQLFAQQMAVLGGQSAGTVLPSVSAAAAPAASQAAPPVPVPAAAAEVKKAHGPFRPVQAGSKDGLTDSERAFIEALIARYSKRTASSKQYTQQHRRHLADPRAVSGFRAIWKEIVYPVVTNRSRGSRIWDLDGNEYIDIVNGFGAILFGHSPEWVSEAVRKQIDAGVEIGPQCSLAGEVAEGICRLTGMERVAFCNTGSEAVMAAMRVARTVTARNTVVYFTGDYHGTFDEVLLRATPKGAAPIAPGVLAGAPGSIVILDYGTDAALEYLRANISSIAAVMVEPVQSRHPDVQPREFLHEVRRITEAGGAALIFDEVVTGFRLTQGGAQNYFGVRADLATYGKVIGGGYPIGVVAGRGPYLDALDGGFWSYGDDSVPEAGMTFFAGTFVRHPLALAAARAVLKHLEEEGPALQEKLAERVAQAARAIEAGFQAMGVDATFTPCATWFIPHFPADSRYTSLLYFLMRERGVHVLENYPCFFTTTHSDDDFQRVIDVFLEAGKIMVDAGMLPAGLAEAQSAAGSLALVLHETAPLTEPQQEILLAAMTGSDANCAFNESIAVWLHGEASETELCAAMEAAIDRHEVLRARVDMLNEQLNFLPPGSIYVASVDLTANDRTRNLALLEEHKAEEARKPFDLTAGPMLRGTLFKFAETEWAFLITGHHLALDGWSANQLVAEAAEIYTAKRRGRAPKLAPVLSFAEYAVDQRSKEAGGEFRDNEDYWVNLYQGSHYMLELPTDRPRPQTKTFNGATCSLRLGAETTALVRQAATRMGSTVYVTMLSAFQILLHRLSGQSSVVIGISTAGQALVDGKSLVGHCVNFLPILSRTEAGETVAAHTRKAKSSLLDAYDHQEFTYGTLLRKLSLPRDPSRLPLIEVQFNLEKLGTGLEFDGNAAEMRANPKGFVNTDLFLNVVEGKDWLDLACDFNTDLFDDSTLERWLASYETILTEMARGADEPLLTLPMLAAGERDDTVNNWNQTETAFPPFQTVNEFLEHRAAQTPERVAAVCAGEQWTCQQLNEYANRVARCLQGQGLGAGDLVGVCVHRSLPMLGALLGVMKAGAAYLPLDPTHPVGRLEAVLEDAGAKLLLTQESLAASLSGTKVRQFTLDGAGKQLLSRESGEDLGLAIRPETTAYVIYTSGSTGKPKGVAISHGALYNLLRGMEQAPGLTAEDTLVGVTTISFDIAALELFLPLMTGAKLVVALREQVVDGFQLLELVQRSGATVMQATPSGWRLLLEAGWEGNPKLKVLCGGEALPRKLADTLLGYGRELWNLYGPTETTIWSSATRVEPGSGPIVVGPPIANTQFYILDEFLQPAPIGVAGELFIGGDGLADGYWKQPELTAERFISNPFHKGRMYRTGDLARRLPSGLIEVLGRTDFQVKIHGYRIELGEIEETISRHPAVREAVVTAADGTGGEKRLDAWVELLPGREFGGVEPELRELLDTNLPEYMRPSTISAIEAFPRTANGKVDRKALLRMAPELKPKVSRIEDYQPPDTPEQELLAAIFAEVLGLERVGVNQNIFELGADSLLVLRMSSRAKKQGIALEPAQIFEYRNIAKLAEVLSNGVSNGHGTPKAEPILRAVSRDQFRRTRA